MRWLLVAGWLLAAGALPACAGEVAVRVVDGGAHAIGDAVVTLRPARDGSAPGKPSGDRPATRFVDQKNETFIPYVQLVRPGDRVVFRNSDHTRHHVYSFSPVKAFEFLLPPGTSSPPLTLEKSGVVAVGCNIHDHMIAYLVVTADRARVTGGDGVAVFAGVPPGAYVVQVWHPQLRPGQDPPSARVVVAAASTPRQVSFTLSLIPDPRGFADREHLDY